MSFIKKEGNESSLWDWIILIGIVLGGGSFWLYYQYQKSSTLDGFSKADSLFKAGEYQKSLDVYDILRYSDYLETAHDSILTERLDTLYQLLEDDSP